MKEQILSHLFPSYPWTDRFHWFDSIGSTNDEAKRMALSGAPHGTVLAAGYQTNGHGRMGRSFHSPENVGVYMTVLLRPGCAPQELMHLTCATAVAMCDAVEAAAGFRPGIKWTNDLVSSCKKLGVFSPAWASSGMAAWTMPSSASASTAARTRGISPMILPTWPHLFPWLRSTLSTAPKLPPP